MHWNCLKIPNVYVKVLPIVLLYIWNLMEGASNLEFSRASKKRSWSKLVGGCDSGRLWIQLLVMENTPFILQQLQAQQNTATSTHCLFQVVLFLKYLKLFFLRTYLGKSHHPKIHKNSTFDFILIQLGSDLIFPSTFLNKTDFRKCMFYHIYQRM